jgi:hypothetical protein
MKLSDHTSATLNQTSTLQTAIEISTDCAIKSPANELRAMESSLFKTPKSQSCRDFCG